MLDPVTEIEIISDEALALSNALAANSDDAQARQKLAELALRAARAAERALSRGDENLFTGYRTQFVKYFAQARPGLEAMAGRGIGAAEYALGVFALHGIFEERNVERACAHFASALGKGFGGAKFRHAQCIEDSDPARALTLMQEAANAGHVGAIEQLGRICLEAEPPDAACAYARLERASREGRLSATTLLGWMHVQGIGGKVDLPRAARYYREAAEKGEAAARNNLGELYETGRGVRQGYCQGLRLLSGSCRQADSRRPSSTSAASTRPAAARRRTWLKPDAGCAKRQMRGFRPRGRYSTSSIRTRRSSLGDFPGTPGLSARLLPPAVSRRIKSVICLALLLLAGCAAVPPGTLRDTDHPLAGRLWDIGTQSFIDEAELLRRAASAEVLLLGETHDNPEHHRLQLGILQARLAAGARPALLMEQFDSDQQAALDEARRAGKDLAPLMRGWDWPQYQPLVALADKEGLPLKAANLPRSAMRPVVREGYSTLPAGDVQRLALERVWDAARQAYMVGLIEGSHCGMVSPQLRDGLVRAQRLRDATLADAALGQIDTGVIFILGRGHARRDVGVPIYLAARHPASRRAVDQLRGSRRRRDGADRLRDGARRRHRALRHPVVHAARGTPRPLPGLREVVPGYRPRAPARTYPTRGYRPRVPLGALPAGDAAARAGNIPQGDTVLASRSDIKTGARGRPKKTAVEGGSSAVAPPCEGGGWEIRSGRPTRRGR